MLSPHSDLKAYEHTEVGRTTQEVETSEEHMRAAVLFHTNKNGLTSSNLKTMTT